MTSQTQTQTPARREIKAQGRSLTWLAARIGVERSYFSRMVDGERRMPAHVATALAAILGLPVEVIQPVRTPESTHA